MLRGHRDLGRNDQESVIFLAWESPWPARTGAALRSLGLLNEIRKAFKTELVVLTRKRLTAEQESRLGALADSVTRIPLLDVGCLQKARAIPAMLASGLPYHSAILRNSLRRAGPVLGRIADFPGAVFTSNGHWGSLVRSSSAPAWILNQCDADVEFWRVYGRQSLKVGHRLAARLNYLLARRHFPSIYRKVGAIISVSEEDRQLTLPYAGSTGIHVVENGVDCAHMSPSRRGSPSGKRLLFTGTSAARNVMALARFVRGVLPLIRMDAPDIELLVAGNFSEEAQTPFRNVQGLRFTGLVDDIRPCFDESDVFIAPFEETHGSKLKVAEAMAMAMPIVASPQGIRGFPLKHGESVLLAQNDRQFAAEVVGLLGDPERREHLGQAARELAKARLDWGILGQRTVKIIEDVLAGRDLPRCRTA